MVTNEMTSNAKNSQESPLILKSITAVGVAVFSGFMFMNWQHTLSETKVAKEAEKVVATQANTTSSTAPVQIEPVAINSTATVSQTPVETTVTNQSVSSSAETSFVEAEAEITDPNLIASLNQKLYNEVDQAWQQTPTFSDNLVYQVQVQENGEIADYSPLNAAASDYLTEVPIDELYNKKAAMLSEKVAKFLVVLTPSGNLQVNPWLGKS
ncbi:hypothetical protein M595_5263 [Lyngbya aestuarii BL J]|uniref:Uncharacterized protein n=1 Tax=Lyngbya aestuarii BL J TaxID=1348334 RepID=U7QAE1_9CYAN|nr:hypothetical protein [Lyngbya aestuarii]ERT04793.1 hypothetical protein M595_5263 [Lyngbya aestuarii BL J]